MKIFFQVWFNEYTVIFRDIGCLLIFFGAFIIYPFFYPAPYTNEVLKNVPVAVIMSPLFNPNTGEPSTTSPVMV